MSIGYGFIIADALLLTKRTGTTLEEAEKVFFDCVLDCEDWPTARALADALDILPTTEGEKQ